MPSAPWPTKGGLPPWTASEGLGAERRLGSLEARRGLRSSPQEPAPKVRMLLFPPAGPEDGLLIGASSLAQLEYADSSSLQPDHSRAIAAWLCCSAAHAFGSTPLGPAPTSPRARRPRPPSCPRPCARLSTARGRRRGRAPSATGAPTLPTCPAVTPSTPAPATRRTGPSERRGREAVSHASTVRAVVRDGTGRRAGAVGRDDGFGAAACHISCHGIQLSS